MRKPVVAAVLLILCVTTIYAADRPAVARMWRGKVTAAKADEYETYLDTGVQALKKIKGNLGVQMFRGTGDPVEFVVISYWPDRDAIRAYAGADIEKIHHLPRDAEFIVNGDEQLHHYDVRIDWRPDAPKP
ncbi:MAG: antibiotic biosynthesis monooxygenase family protein [Thermoanaerobaculia bacterium]